MTQYRIQSHEVTVSKVTGLQPLIGPNTAVLSPDFGLLLVLEDSTKQKWLCEKGGVIPATGDFFVTDKELGVTFVVAAAKFGELFQESKDAL